MNQAFLFAGHSVRHEIIWCHEDQELGLKQTCYFHLLEVQFW